jgi:hypothetical protein
VNPLAVNPFARVVVENELAAIAGTIDGPVHAIGERDSRNLLGVLYLHDDPPPFAFAHETDHNQAGAGRRLSSRISR